MKKNKLMARVFFYDKGMKENLSVVTVKESIEDINKFIDELPSAFEFISVEIKEWG